MVINQQRWQHDTCQCVYIENYNTDTDTFSINHFEVICSPHSSISDDTTRYNTLVNDNKRKNFFLDSAMTSLPTQLTQNFTREDGSTFIGLKNNIKYNFTFSGTGQSRVLTVSFTGITLTTQQKNTLQSLANQKFGVGKVVIQ